MRTLVLFAHPVAESLSAALHTTVVDTLTARGWEVDDCDLYAEGFQPVLTAEERRGYHDVETNCAPVQSYVDRVRRAEALVLVFPVWNFGYPAILKGFLDRVFLPGVSFKIENQTLVPNLHNIKRLAAVTTYGGAASRAFLVGDPPKKSVTRHLRAVVHPKCRTRYLALYGMNKAEHAKRAAFVARVAREMERL
ncbi:MAG: NAD(P)H-dependent oxidoreductase [Pseudomonadota bacterium]